MYVDLYRVPANAAERVMADPSSVHALIESLYGGDLTMSLEKCWHGIHFALTNSAWEGNPPLNFLVAGGEPIGEEDLGYGPARMVNPDAVLALDAALSRFSDAEFEQKFLPERMAEEAIYPSIWDEPLPDLLEEFGEYFRQMKDFVRRAADADEAIIVALT